MFPTAGSDVSTDMTSSQAAAAIDPAAESMEQPGGFAEVYALHAAAVLRFCVSQVGDRATGEDLTHETFVKAFRAWSRANPDPEGVRTWLLSIARNAGRDHHRAGHRRRGLLLRLGRDRLDESHVETLAQHRLELRRAIEGLGALSARDRELIGLRVAADLSYREVAALVGTTEAAAKVATFRALRRLRQRLEDHP